MSLSPTDLAAYGAVVGTAVGLVVQLVNTLRKRSKEKEEVHEALDRAPLVREQLWLGNVSGAVAQLNLIIEQQSSHIRRQDVQIRELLAEVQGLRDELEQRKVT